jgi:S-DNA-T family DNA segregation ATPase FtsK/SpoIIIE
MPHMLIAGTTGSGKSVCMNSIIMSWLYTKRPDELKLILVDPKMVELSQFADIPHLACPVITEMSKAAASLEWAIAKMDERYHLFKKTGVRHLTEYNALSNDEREELIGPTNDLEKARIPHHLPYLVFMIDELSDLMMTNREVEQSIVRIAQKARATGIHLILATQRPQRQVVTGLIKSNMPCRIAFKVAGGIDSKIILDSMGAELLTGQGDMMVVDPGEPLVKRAQGAFVADPEVRKTVAFLKTVAAPSFERSLIALPSGNASSNEEGNGAKDPLFEEAVEIIVEAGRGSASLLQRRLSVGYSRASRMVEQMADAGILGDHVGSKARAVQISMEDWEQMKKMGSGINAANEFDDDAFDDDGAGVPGEYAGEYRG